MARREVPSLAREYDDGVGGMMRTDRPPARLPWLSWDDGCDVTVQIVEGPMSAWDTTVEPWQRRPEDDPEATVLYHARTDDGPAVLALSGQLRVAWEREAARVRWCTGAPPEVGSTWRVRRKGKGKATRWSVVCLEPAGSAPLSAWTPVWGCR